MPNAFQSYSCKHGTGRVQILKLVVLKTCFLSLYFFNGFITSALGLLHLSLKIYLARCTCSFFICPIRQNISTQWKPEGQFRVHRSLSLHSVVSRRMQSLGSLLCTHKPVTTPYPEQSNAVRIVIAVFTEACYFTLW
jgi:hypothetical protein